jgi:hypothetical protein
LSGSLPFFFDNAGDPLPDTVPVPYTETCMLYLK